jgi:hypothetical protein
VGVSCCRIGFLYGKYVEDKDSKDKSDKRMKVRYPSILVQHMNGVSYVTGHCSVDHCDRNCSSTMPSRIYAVRSMCAISVFLLPSCKWKRVLEVHSSQCCFNRRVTSYLVCCYVLRCRWSASTSRRRRPPTRPSRFYQTAKR